MSWIKSLFSEDDKQQKAPNSKMPQLNEPVEAITESSVMPIEEVNQLLEEVDRIIGTAQPITATSQQSPVAQPSATQDQQKSKSLQNAVNQPKGKGRHNGATQPKGTVQPNGTTQSKGVTPPVFIPRIVEVDEKLTIILVENTKEVAKEKDKLEKIVKNLVMSGYVCVINYGSLVREVKAVEAKAFDSKNILWETFIGDRACLFDAITTLESVVEENYKKTEMIKGKKIRIKTIDIIGIGRCIDDCSITSSESACKSFGRIAKYSDVTTKYFCLSEESFVEAAKIGFHSIGAFPKNYM